MSTRGEHLVRADRRFATGGGVFARLGAPAIARVLDEVDRRLEHGGLETTLPGGSKRRLGFRKEGPRAVVHIASWMALVRLATSGSVGWYKAWTLGEWSSPDPVKIFELFSINAAQLGDVGRAKGPFRWMNTLAHRLRDNAPGKARKNIAAHYDLGNDFSSEWLDPTMTYSSARFASMDESLEAAKRGVSVVGLTLSTEQKPWAERKIAEAGLGDRIEIRLQDYRDTAEQFDAVASVEMVEAVGQRWWPAYLDCIARNLKPGGRAALQFIAMRHDIFERYARNPDFIQTYIFPGGLLLDEPSFEALAAERGLSWRDRDGFRLDYAETLKRWRERYDQAVARGELAGFAEPFHHLWRYYLMYCEGGFRGGAIDVAQVTMVKA
jgi:cyclopropane-fatty-acyl-phospholipid synthase